MATIHQKVKSSKVRSSSPTHVKATRTPCTLCHRSFSRRYDLQRHMDLKHNPNVLKIPCPRASEGCTYASANATNLKTHFIAVQLRPFKCSEHNCLSAFGDGAALIRHELHMHGISRNGMKKNNIFFHGNHHHGETEEFDGDDEPENTDSLPKERDREVKNQESSMDSTPSPLGFQLLYPPLEEQHATAQAPTLIAKAEVLDTSLEERLASLRMSFATVVPSLAPSYANSPASSMSFYDGYSSGGPATPSFDTPSMQNASQHPQLGTPNAYLDAPSFSPFGLNATQTSFLSQPSPTYVCNNQRFMGTVFPAQQQIQQTQFPVSSGGPFVNGWVCNHVLSPTIINVQHIQQLQISSLPQVQPTNDNKLGLDLFYFEAYYRQTQ